ncbi:alkaline phosphatase family protein [Acidobacteriota bacterium]
MEDTLNVNSALVKAIRQAYQLGQEDEALDPIVLVDSLEKPVGRIDEGDSVIFYDIRGEREIEITESLTEGDFIHFTVKGDLDLNFVTMIEYKSSLKSRVAFPPEGDIKNTLTEVITKSGIPLIKIAESEKAIHICYFMNGKNENPFYCEERLIVPSPENVSSYSQTPGMSADKVTEALSAQIEDPASRVIIGNLANVDVLGHIEDREAVLQAIEYVDNQLGTICEACQSNGVTLVVTADHGTVEEWQYSDGTINTGHTKNPVPFILADFGQNHIGRHELRESGELSDVAPTLLELLDLDIPQEMTGKSLLLSELEKNMSERRILLLILDGWGMNKEGYGNLISEASTPNFEKMWDQFPHSVLDASGIAVGMPDGTVGNSEAGHLHIGAGRQILLDRVRIDRAIEDGSFSQNPEFLWAMNKAKESDKSLHLLGIVSHYSSHGTIDHLYALLQMARDLDVPRVFVHSLIGRRGERPESGARYVSKVENMCDELQTGRVVTVMGRHWALDREEHWDRVEKAYRALVYGDGTPAPSNRK